MSKPAAWTAAPEICAVRDWRLVVRLVESRDRAWWYEDVLEAPRSPTFWPERWTYSCRYLAFVAQRWQRKALELYQTVKAVRKPEGAIRYVFGEYAEQALRVAQCESGLSMTPRAHNGQYLGMFQMGDYARGRYGHGPDPLTQARAAYRYFVDSGRDWSPWGCRP
jgi:hypothetical protein